MNVSFNEPILISVSSAKLICESEGRGTVEFTVLDQPVHINIISTSYVYDINFVVNDRVRLKEDFGELQTGSNGIVKSIKPDRTEDIITIYFDKIYPNKDITNVNKANVNSTVVSIVLDVPLSKIEKV
jgi:hypothetical protein